jgi:hypothetical protein
MQECLNEAGSWLQTHNRRSYTSDQRSETEKSENNRYLDQSSTLTLFTFMQETAAESDDMR